jgi:hypothetical protein
MKLSDLFFHYTRALELFDYTPSDTPHDTIPKPYHTNLLHGYRYSGNEATFASTFCEFLVAYKNVPASDVYYILCNDENSSPHVVCGIILNGDLLILDSRKNELYRYIKLPYEYERFTPWDGLNQWITTTNNHFIS